MARAVAAPALVAASVLLLAMMLLALSGGAAAAGEVPLSWELGGGEDSFGFSSEGADADADAAADGASVVRRVLQSQGYISYGALRRDTTPCSVRGASYYNCRPGGQANPYSRGCSAITRCRG
ncbi:hypothetical protein GUJ93_ZPchr0008g13689 [Zizania palustris]|uniref:Uncharacterized protein n=1 Tax=Zizania palustris TaxID=103762 RepID=A0A8J5R4R2_ZIZPA|nr:hypothetical protein GUJ93_ZPchr0008g13689 [Zizania palustris]